MEKQLKLYAHDYTDYRTYLLGALFVICNIIFPQMCHQLTLGGPTWLPIYFFTLIGSYKYGMKVGLITALLSPITNSLLFGMPMLSSVFVITVKSTLLAICAGYTAARFHKATIILLTAVVIAYQVGGSLVECIVTDFHTAMQDFRIGFPGIMTQIIGGWLIINYAIRK